MRQRYLDARAELERSGEAKMLCRGNSMLPVLPNPALCFYRREETYEVGDIVFCLCVGRFIDAHFIHAVQGGRYRIGNNHGFINGWTRSIYGRVVRAEDELGRTVYRARR